MKTTVNTDCIGCGMCVNICPQVFDFDDNGLSIVVGDCNDYPELVMEAAEICPVNAIEVQQ